MQVKSIKGLVKSGDVNAAVRVNVAVLYGEQGDASVERSGVKIKKRKFVCYDFCKGALPCGRVAVNGYDYVGYAHIQVWYTKRF